MRAIFDLTNRYQKMLEVEAALAKAQAKLRMIPATDARKIAEAASIKKVRPERIAELERETHHETMAVVLALAEAAGKSGRFVHFGATSNDILDTATALQVKEALQLVETRIKEIMKELIRLARRHRRTIMVGRTHGQHAVPITLGLKFSVWICELGRHLERLQQIRPRVLVGKMSGAVGTGAAWGKKAAALQATVMRLLELHPPDATTQILQRDRFAELISFIALVASTFDKIAREIRNLQRTEIEELAEPFAEKQVGSSTMPHKRNPIRCEKICGLARVLRSQVAAALENVVLEHERDLTNSSCERVLLPQSFLLLDEILRTAHFVIKNLRIFPERISRNLQLTRGLHMAEAVMIELARRGMNRQEAHKLLRRCSSKAVLEHLPLADILKAEPEITKYLSPKEIDALLDPYRYLGVAPAIVDRVTSKFSSMLE